MLFWMKAQAALEAAAVCMHCSRPLSIREDPGVN